MKQRGRKSSEALAVRVNGSRPRLVPPAYLTKEQRAMFLQVVNSCKPEHFVPSDTILLSAFIQSATINQDSGRRMTTDPKMIRVFDASAKTMGNLATKLRLAPQSRSAPTTAARNTGVGRTGRPRTNFLLGEGDDE